MIRVAVRITPIGGGESATSRIGGVAEKLSATGSAQLQPPPSLNIVKNFSPSQRAQRVEGGLSDLLELLGIESLRPLDTLLFAALIPQTVRVRCLDEAGEERMG